MERIDTVWDPVRVILLQIGEFLPRVVLAIVIIIVVFLPLFSLSDLECKLFKPMALTITFAMAGRDAPGAAHRVGQATP